MRRWGFLAGAALVTAALGGCGDGGGDTNRLRVETLAGGPTIGDDGPATATFLDPQGMAVDAAGNVFILDANEAIGSILVRRVDVRDGTISTVAGDCERRGGDDAPTDACQLHDLAGLAVHRDGDLFVNTYDGRVFRIDARSRALQHLAGRGGFDCTETAGAPALEACIEFASATVLDAAGKLYLAEPQRVRRLDTASTPLEVIAGKVLISGFCHGGPDGVLATEVCLASDDIALDQRGNLLIVGRSTDRLSRVDASGIITTIAGMDGPCRGDRGDGGPAVAACFASPHSVTVDRHGNVLIADLDSIRMIEAATGTISTVAVRSNLDEIRSAPDGSVIFSEQGGRVSRLQISSGEVTGVAGNGTLGLCGEGGPARDACLGQPFGLALTPDGTIYFAGSEHARIGRIDAASGITTTIAGGRQGFCGDGGPAIDACFRNVTDVVLDHDGNLYLADRGADDQGSAGDLVGRVRRIDAATGTITTVAGGCTRFGSVRATEACLFHPSVLLFDAEGDLLIGQRGGIRRVDLRTDTISVVAGPDQSAPGITDCTANDILATESCLNPGDLALDSAGNLYVLDLDGARVRRIDAATKRVTTVAGNGVLAFCGEEDVPAAGTCLFPWAIAIDGAGRLIIADGGGFRAVDLTTGLIRTIPGGADREACLLDAPTPADCILPTDIERDATGRLIVTEVGTRRIQRVTLP